MNGNETVIATFTQNLYTLATQITGQGNVLVRVQYSQQTTWASGSIVQLTATAAPGWTFSSWSGSTDIASTSANPTTITMNSNETVTATFIQNGYTLSISVNPSGAGVPIVSVNPSIGDYYPSGTLVTLTAKAATGWTFSGWSGSTDFASTTANPTTITMNGNEVVTATFIQMVVIAPPNLVINASSWKAFPPAGVYVQSGQTLNLSWSASGSTQYLNCFIFNATQYNNWQLSGEVVATSEAHGSGSQGPISATIQNSDTYYAVLFNDAYFSPIFGGPSVTVNESVLTER